MLSKDQLKQVGSIVQHYNDIPDGCHSGVRIEQAGLIVATGDHATNLVTEARISFDIPFGLMLSLEQTLLGNLARLAMLAGIPKGTTIH